MTRTWSEQDRDEYGAACAESWGHAESTHERASHFLGVVQDAAQAHRPWALNLYLSQISAYRDNLHVVSRLLELRDLAPAAATPDEAARQIGTTVDDWLDQSAA